MNWTCHRIKTTWYTLAATAAAAVAASLQLCPTLSDPIDSSPPGSPVPGILQARILEWVAISFSSAWKWKVKVKSLNCVWLLATPWTAAYQAPPPMGLSRQEYWSRVPPPSPYTCVTPLYRVEGEKQILDWMPVCPLAYGPSTVGTVLLT